MFEIKSLLSIASILGSLATLGTLVYMLWRDRTVYALEIHRVTKEFGESNSDELITVRNTGNRTLQLECVGWVSPDSRRVIKLDNGAKIVLPYKLEKNDMVLIIINDSEYGRKNKLVFCVRDTENRIYYQDEKNHYHK